jgi:hypothetical protein
MEIDTDKIDQAVLALRYRILNKETRVWKSFDWDAMNGLRAKGFIQTQSASQVGATHWRVTGIGAAVREASRARSGRHAHGTCLNLGGQFDRKKLS